MQGEGVEGLFTIALRAGQFQVQVVVERALPVGEVLFGQVMAAGQCQACLLYTSRWV